MRAEKEISLLDLFFYILSKWKIIFITGIIGAFLLGAISYLNSYNQYKDSLVASEAATQSSHNLTEKEINAVEAKIALIREYEADIVEYDYYLENSIKVKMNPNKFYQGTLTYYFEDTKAKAFCEEEIMREDNFKELAVLLTKESDETLIKEVVCLEKDEDENTLSIKIEHYDKDECSIMLEYFGNKMKSIENELISRGILVNAQKIIADIGTYSNYENLELGTAIKNKRAVAYDNISLLESKMTVAQKEYYVLMHSEGSEKDTDDTTRIINPEVNKIFVVAGAILGAFASICLYGVCYLFSNRIHTKEELESLISIPVYKYELELDKKINFIDSTLNSLKKKLPDRSVETPEMIAQMLFNTAKQVDAKKVYFAGYGENIKSEVIKHIRTMMIAEDLDVIMGNSILENVESLQVATECGYAVLVEKCNVSLEKDIRLEIAKADTCGIKVLGVILED